MNFTKEEIKQIKTTFKFVKNVKTIEVLKQLLINPVFGGDLEIIGTDLELCGILTFKNKGKVEPTLIPYECFTEPFEFEHKDENKLAIKYEFSEKEINKLPVEDFPLPCRGNQVYVATFDEKTVAEIMKVAPYIGNDKLREILSQIKLECKDNELKIVATCGHRLAVNTYTNSDNFDIILSYNFINKLDYFTLFEQPEFFVAHSENLILFCKKFDGTYPYWKRIVDDTKDKTKEFSVNADKLKKALSVFPKSRERSKDKSVTNIKFNIKTDVINLSFTDHSDNNEYKSVVECLCTDPVVAGFRKEYVEDVCNTFKGKNITFKFDNPDKMFLVEQDNMLVILMPVRLPKEGE